MKFTFIILCVPLTLLGMSSAEPKLSLTATHDVTFTCDMSGFEGEMAQLLSLQIVKKRSGNDRNVVFAYVDHSEVKPANLLEDIHPYHQLNGNFSIRRKRDSWLKLTIFKIDPNEDGVYACQIHHTAHPADTRIATWERTVLVNISDEAAPPKHPKGFSVSVRRSVHAVCEYETRENPNSIKPVSYSALVKEDGTELASWSNNSANHITENRVSTIFVRVERMETSWKIIFEIPRNKCEESWKCHCTVQSFSESSLTSPSQVLPRHSCPHFSVRKQDPSPTSVPTKYIAVNTAGDAPLKHFTLGMFASVAVVVIIVAIVGLVIFFRKRAKRALSKKQRHTPEVDIDLNEQQETLIGQATTRADTEDVDVDNDQKRQSLLSDSSDKVSVTSSVLDLL